MPAVIINTVHFKICQLADFLSSNVLDTYCPFKNILFDNAIFPKPLMKYYVKMKYVRITAK